MPLPTDWRPNLSLGLHASSSQFSRTPSTINLADGRVCGEGITGAITGATAADALLRVFFSPTE